MRIRKTPYLDSFLDFPILHSVRNFGILLTIAEPQIFIIRVDIASWSWVLSVSGFVLIYLAP